MKTIRRTCPNFFFEIKEKKPKPKKMLPKHFLKRPSPHHGK
jgi:hypothetical protein